MDEAPKHDLGRMRRALNYVSVVILSPDIKWEPMPGMWDHPEVTAYTGSLGQWKFIVIGEPPKKEGNTEKIACGGTATNSTKGILLFLPLDIAHKAWKIAEEQAAKKAQTNS